jgi:hypothetical protein
MFSKIRYSIAEKILSTKARRIRRIKVVHNFKTCRNSVILYDATRSEDFETISEFMRFLNGLSIENNLIGYVNHEQVHSNLLLRNNCHFFCNKDLSLFYLPKTFPSKEFLNRKFDILFNFTISDTFPLRYLSALSIADFKVGKYGECECDLDLMIDITREPRLDYLIEQIKIYVSRLNNPEKESH